MHRLTRQVVAKQLNKPIVRQGILQRSITTAFRLAPPKVAAKPLLTHSRYLGTHPAFNRRMATLATNDYKDIAFLKWKLFPNFEYLLTQTEPAVAVPIFKKLLDAAQQQFLAMKFEPTYEGTIGQCKLKHDEHFTKTQI
jgi:oligopeptidase A